MKLSTVFVSGFMLLPLVGFAFTAPCNINDSVALANTSNMQNPNPQICQAIYWNSWQGCIQNPVTQGNVKFCANTALTFMQTGPISTMQTNCGKGDQGADCVAELYYFSNDTSDPAPQTMTVDGSTQLTIYPQNCAPVTSMASAANQYSPSEPSASYSIDGQNAFTCTLSSSKN